VRTIWYSTREAGAVDKGVRRGGGRGQEKERDTKKCNYQVQSGKGRKRGNHAITLALL